MFVSAHLYVRQQLATLFRRVVEVFNSRNFDALDDLLAPNFIDHNPGPGQEPGIQGIKEAWAQFFAADPYLILTLEDIIVEGDIRWRPAPASRAHGGRRSG